MQYWVHKDIKVCNVMMLALTWINRMQFYRWWALITRVFTKPCTHENQSVTHKGELMVMHCECSRESKHYCDAIMSTMASQITSHTIVYLIVHSDPDQRKHQRSASLAFVWEIHRWQKGMINCMQHRSFKVYSFVISDCAPVTPSGVVERGQKLFK